MPLLDHSPLMDSFFDNLGRPKARITVGGSRKTSTIDAVFDTGFDGYLSLPIPLAIQLGLELIGIESVEYADGRIAKELVFTAIANLNGKNRIVRATLTESFEALAGIRLFVDSKVILDFPGRKISITRSKI